MPKHSRSTKTWHAELAPSSPSSPASNTTTRSPTKRPAIAKKNLSSKLAKAKKPLVKPSLVGSPSNGLKRIGRNDGVYKAKFEPQPETPAQPQVAAPPSPSGGIADPNPYAVLDGLASPAFSPSARRAPPTPTPAKNEENVFVKLATPVARRTRHAIKALEQVANHVVNEIQKALTPHGNKAQPKTSRLAAARATKRAL